MTKVQQKQIQRRYEIVEALIPLISSVPFDELSVADICASAGISIGSFYHYFEKKSDILVGLLSLIDEYMEQQVFPRLNSEDAAENLRRFAHGWGEHVAAGGIERSKLISSIRPSDHAHNLLKRSSLMKLEEIIGAGQRRGLIIADREAAALAGDFLLALRGVTTDWSRRDGDYSVTERIDSFMELFIRALKP